MNAFKRSMCYASAMPRKKIATLKIKVDAQLSIAYRDAYERTLSFKEKKPKPINNFMAGFVEDRLLEEIKFLKRHANDFAE